jgi:hypothetical protein
VLNCLGVMCRLGGGDEVGYSHSGPTPRGREDSVARAEFKRVLRSTNASILLMVVVLRLAVREVCLRRFKLTMTLVNMPAVCYARLQPPP